jgi:hypothetical protein
VPDDLLFGSSLRVRHRPQADPHGMKPSSRGGEADEAIQVVG